MYSWSFHQREGYAHCRAGSCAHRDTNPLPALGRSFHPLTAFDGLPVRLRQAQADTGHHEIIMGANANLIAYLTGVATHVDLIDGGHVAKITR